MSLGSQKRRPFNADFSGWKCKNQLEPGQEDAPVLPHFSLLKNPSPEPTGVLEHCRGGEID
jgi:hypothetical protein